MTVGTHTACQRLILDVDTGIDDAMAILLALGAPEAEVLGVTTVCGNVGLVQATRNSLQVLELAGRPDIGVYCGADRPLARTPVHAEAVHGASGLGQAVLPEPAQEVAGAAVDFLVEQLSGPAAVTVVALGPLTNLALAEQRAPGILRRALKIVAMGGAVRVPGNVAATAEFNFYADPEAARQVVQAGAELVLVTLDSTDKVGLSSGDLAVHQGTLGRFCQAAAATAIDFEKRDTGFQGFHLHDPTAVALALAPQLGRFETVWVDIETQGRLTAGQVVADLRRLARTEDRSGRPVACTVDVDRDGVVDIFTRWVLEL
ncbi:MAG: nucleoside hydrolase [Candidatus Latescibacteria bacterium]|nr:nucleoside hydrolase [Candidatus Latescibacterota bacterium]